MGIVCGRVLQNLFGVDNTTTAQQRIPDEAPGHGAVEIEAHSDIINHLNAVCTGQAVDSELPGAAGGQKPGIRVLERLGVDRVSIGKFGVAAQRKLDELPIFRDFVRAGKHRFDGVWIIDE